MGYLNDQLTKVASAIKEQKPAIEKPMTTEERLGYGALGAINSAGGGYMAGMVPEQFRDSKKLLSAAMEDADPAVSKLRRALQGFKRLDGHGKLGVLAPALTGAMSLAGTGIGLHHLNKAFSKENAKDNAK